MKPTILAVLLLTSCAPSKTWTRASVEEAYEPHSEEGYACRDRCRDKVNVQERYTCWRSCQEKHGGEYTEAQYETCSSKGGKITCEANQ